jgi:hypothetical protein
MSFTLATGAGSSLFSSSGCTAIFNGRGLNVGKIYPVQSGITTEISRIPPLLFAKQRGVNNGNELPLGNVR